VRSILDYTREQNVTRLVIATSMASQNLQTYFRRFRRTGDANVEPRLCFQGDDETLLGSLIGKAEYSQSDIRQACHCVSKVLQNMRKSIVEDRGRVLVLCQVGRNRSFTTAFLYFVVYHTATKGRHVSALNALKLFKAWPGVSYDAHVQQDGSQRLCVKAGMSMPWMRGIARIFEDESSGVITRQRINAFLAC
jgi:hypothetical protein